MSTLASQPARTARPPSPPSGEQHLLLDGVDWPSYLAIGRALVDQPGLRLTYQRGSLEFMTTSPQHEIYKKHLARFIEILAEELDQPFATAGSMTFQHEDLRRGLEADDCFWFEHESVMRGKLTWDYKADPPPDLGLEIEITRSALDCMDIYARLRVPEVWRFDGRQLTAYRLRSDGTYQQEPASHIFPSVPLDQLVSFLDLAQTTDVLSVIRSFRQWARSLRPAGGQGPVAG
jgi:Uma2 family endonuclease